MSQIPANIGAIINNTSDDRELSNHYIVHIVTMKAQLAQLIQDTAVCGDGSCQGKYEVGTRGIAVECSYSSRHLNFYPEKSRYYGGCFAAELGGLELLSPIVEVSEPPSKPRWISSCEGACFSGSEGADAAQSWVDATMGILISANVSDDRQKGSA